MLAMHVHHVLNLIACTHVRVTTIDPFFCRLYVHACFNHDSCTLHDRQTVKHPTHHGVFLTPKRYAMKFVKRCIGGVIIMMSKAVVREGGETMREKRRAPITKSS